MFKISIRYTGAVPGSANLSQRAWNALMREVWAEVGRYWHEHFLPKHFTRAGAREYGYEPRKGEEGGLGGKAFWRSYTGRKQRLKHHRDPLVWSGELRALSRMRRIVPFATANRSGVSVRLPAARKANWRNPHSTIDMADELTRVSEAEARELVALYERLMQERLDRLHATINVHL